MRVSWVCRVVVCGLSVYIHISLIYPDQKDDLQICVVEAQWVVMRGGTIYILFTFAPFPSFLGIWACLCMGDTGSWVVPIGVMDDFPVIWLKSLLLLPAPPKLGFLHSWGVRAFWDWLPGGLTSKGVDHWGKGCMQWHWSMPWGRGGWVVVSEEAAGNLFLLYKARLELYSKNTVQ